jgi:hypothetical protein
MQLGQIACLGEVMIEVARAGGEAARIGVAGDTFNTAVYLSRALGPGRTGSPTGSSTPCTPRRWTQLTSRGCPARCRGST